MRIHDNTGREETTVCPTRLQSSPRLIGRRLHWKHAVSTTLACREHPQRADHRWLCDGWRFVPAGVRQPQPLTLSESDGARGRRHPRAVKNRQQIANTGDRRPAAHDAGSGAKSGDWITVLSSPKSPLLVRTPPLTVLRKIVRITHLLCICHSGVCGTIKRHVA